MEKSIYKSSEGEKLIMNVYTDILKKWPVKNEHLYIETSYGETFIIASGNSENPPVVLLHGSGTNSAMWMGDIEKLSENYRVYAIDIIGEPGKSAHSRPSISGNDYKKWIDEIMEKLNIRKAFFIGNSLGGWMALNYAVTYPEKVEKLALIAPSGLYQQKKSFLFKVILLMFLGDFGIDQINSIVYHKVIVPDEVRNFGKIMFKNYNPRMDVMPVYSDDEIKKLTMPVFFIGGEKDALLESKKGGERIKNLLPGSKVEILKDTGHVVINQTDKILEFLK